jgi:hypothetical protein
LTWRPHFEAGGRYAEIQQDAPRQAHPKLFLTYSETVLLHETGGGTLFTNPNKILIGITQFRPNLSLQGCDDRSCFFDITNSDKSMTSTPKIKRIIHEPVDWVKGFVCDECCLPLSLYGYNDFHPTDGDRVVMKLYCDLHAEEFGMRERSEEELIAVTRSSGDDG